MVQDSGARGKGQVVLMRFQGHDFSLKLMYVSNWHVVFIEPMNHDGI
jgi:hypothetical protein